jgi:Flp pilus assembly protein TadG
LPLQADGAYVGAREKVTESGPGRLAAGSGCRLDRDPARASVRRSSRARGDGGAALVEFALVMPVLFLILFGIIEFGVNMNDYQSLRQSVRDATRTAVVADYGTGSCAPSNFSGTVGTQNSSAVVCQVATNSGYTSSALTVKVQFTDNNGANYDTDKVKVCAVASAKSITGIMAPFLKNVYLKSAVEMRAEKVLTLDNVTPTDPSGGNWSWC